VLLRLLTAAFATNATSLGHSLGRSNDELAATVLVGCDRTWAA